MSNQVRPTSNNARKMTSCIDAHTQTIPSMDGSHSEETCEKFWKHVPKSTPAKPMMIELDNDTAGLTEEEEEEGDINTNLTAVTTRAITCSDSTVQEDNKPSVNKSSSSSLSLHLSFDWSLRVERFHEIFKSNIVEIETLRKLSWKGIPVQYRARTWKILLGYLPNAIDRHSSTLERKRKEYREIVKQHFGPNSRRDESIMHQIAIDVPRTAPDVQLFRNPIVRESLARVLYCWSIRRPASGYVQGINDLVTPLYDVFFEEILQENDERKRETIDKKEENNTQVAVSEDALHDVEADSFWCLSILLDGIQDNYTFNQIGITRQLTKMKEIVQRTDPKLLAHFSTEGVTVIQFAFRWINCLLLREFPLYMIIRMWDTYLAEGDTGFSIFHTYVCAAFLCKWSDRLQLLDFQDILLFLQNPPTTTWTEGDLEILLSEAFVWKTIFDGSLANLNRK